MHTHTNKLIEESSPYLLQHAHNPVDWYPWGEEALQRAREENKPILVSIGYAACHWCHVMEKESFEDELTAKFMNEHFINIKIDREERPDLDHIYMDAVQAMTGSGGWPLNVFLTPEKKPFYGGTYFPPVKAFNRASWTETLQGVIHAFREKREQIDAQAENLTEHLVQANSFGLQKMADADSFFSPDKPQEAFASIMKTADTVWGGFGRAPKFPQTFSIQFLLHYHHLKKHQVAADSKDIDSSLEQALLSLDKMIEGGIYDQLAGGFARYSTDTEWLAPHFEKMLYDNALLVVVLSEAYQLTKKERYREVIDETIAFVQRELMHPEKGFYSALDADSEGEEGRFYVWQKKEVEELLGEEAAIFCEFYDVSAKGNWEKKNILRVLNSMETVAANHNIRVTELKDLLGRSKAKLLAARAKRVRPLLDDKILLGWNALMNTALSKAFAATGREEYRRLAVENMEFLLSRLAGVGNTAFFHTWKEGKARYPAFLDDYAFLIQALLHLQEITADTRWLLRAGEITEGVEVQFSEAGTGFFFYTPADQTDIIVRKKEVYDGATPSGNAVMADNLYRLGILMDRRDWGRRCQEMVSSLGMAIVRHPGSFGCWNRLLLEIIGGTVEIAIAGKAYAGLHEKILQEFIPNRVLMATAIENQTFPLLAGKQAPDNPLVYICRNYSCRQPVTSIKAVMSLINSEGQS